VGGDQRRPFTACALEGGLESVVDADERAAADGDGMRGEIGVEIVVGQLQPGEEQQVVVAPRALRLGVDLGEVVGVVPGVHASERRVRGQPRIVEPVDVVGHAEDVEPAAAVQVDELRECERAVAPARVGVELAEQRLDLPAHPVRVLLRAEDAGERAGDDRAATR
jgi:hypothetical protein